MENKDSKKTGVSFSFLIGKTRSFLGLCRKYLNQDFKAGVEVVKITGPISGHLYMQQPADKNVKFVVYKKELRKIKPEVLEALPEEIFFV